MMSLDGPSIPAEPFPGESIGKGRQHRRAHLLRGRQPSKCDRRIPFQRRLAKQKCNGSASCENTDSAKKSTKHGQAFRLSVSGSNKMITKTRDCCSTKMLDNYKKP